MNKDDSKSPIRKYKSEDVLNNSESPNKNQISPTRPGYIYIALRLKIMQLLTENLKATHWEINDMKKI